MKLSLHFDLGEFTRSATAAREGINNEPGPAVLANLARLAGELEKVRLLCNAPLHVLSGYRCPALNAAVGGSKNSYHMLGLAADFDPPPGMTHDQLQHAIGAAVDIDFDLALEERAKDGAHWLHLQIPKDGTTGRRLIRDAELAKQGGAISRVTAG